MKLLRPLIGSAAVVGVASMLGRGSFVLAFIILARGLSPADLAQVSFFVLTLSMIATYGSLGIGVAATRYFALAHDQSADVRPKIHALAAMAVGSTALVVLLMPLAWPLLTSRELDWLFLAALLCVLLDVVPYSAIVGLQRYAHAVRVSAVSAVVLIAGSLLAADRSSYRLALAAIALSYAVKAVGDGIWAAKPLGRGFWRPFRVERAEVRHVAALVGPMAITSVLAGSGAWTVGEMVRAQWSDLDYALYAIGLQWYAIGLFVPGMLMIVLFPLQVRAAGPNANSVSETRRLLVQGGIPMLIASAAMLLVALPLSPLLVRFYGPSFEGESWIIWGFIAAAGAAAPATLLGNNLVAAGRQLEWTAYTAVWLAVLLASSFVAVRAGARFTPAAFIIASTVLTGLSAWAVLRSRPGGAALPDPR